MLQKTSKDKKVYIEFLRVLAAFFVVANHVFSPMFFFPTISKSWFVCITLFFMSKFAVPVFLMISGSLLLTKNDSISKYLNRVIRWSVLIVIFTVFYHVYYSYDEIGGVVTFLQRIFGGSTVSHWYMFMYLGILVMLPLLQKLAQVLEKEHLQIFLIVSLGLGGIFPMISAFSEITVSNEFLDVIFSPYLGMFFCGYYIDNYVEITKKRAIICGCLYILLIAIQVIGTTLLYYEDNQNYLLLDNRIFITITSSAICVYIVIKYIFENITLAPLLNKMIVSYGGLTLGIFLISDMFINFFYPYLAVYLGSVNIFVLLFLYTIWIFICSSIAAYIFKKIPGLKALL